MKCLFCRLFSGKKKDAQPTTGQKPVSESAISVVTDLNSETTKKTVAPSSTADMDVELLVSLLTLAYLAYKQESEYSSRLEQLLKQSRHKRKKPEIQKASRSNIVLF